MTAASRIVDAIIEDLIARSGLDSAWFGIDGEIRDEIRDTWEAIVVEKLDEKEGS